ncbi:MAG: radical SAM protein [Candidatus Omnitrophica bacterium]|nr:radical SAM protein [Candidatus Omnitrophota bacterium]
MLKLIQALKKYGADIRLDKFSINIKIDFKKTNLSKIKPFLYLLLNNFENSYFITIENMPYCIMPDAEEHIIYPASESWRGVKGKSCPRCKYFDICPGWPKDLRKTKKLKPHPVNDLPQEIVVEVTQRCNLNCLLCFKEKKIKDVPLKNVKEIIDQCHKLGIKTIRFTGGEPLLYKDIGKVLRYAKKKGFYVILNTNVTILNKKMKVILKNYVDNILVSLQGFNPASEKKLTQARLPPRRWRDRDRQANFSFQEKLKNIIELNSLIPTVRLGTIISRTLIDNFYKYYYLIKKLGIKNWEMFRPMTEKKISQYRISGNDLLKLMHLIKEIKGGIGQVQIANPVPFCLSSDFDLSTYVLLGARADDGNSRLVFDTRGFFKPSYPMCENLGADIVGAWQNPFLKKIRSLSYLPQRCRDCFYLKWCKGGSRYLAGLKYGSYFKPDPLL